MPILSAAMTLYRLTDPSFLENPAPVLARMRAEGPLVRARLPLMGQFWLTTTDEATRALLKTPEIFRRDPKPITGKSQAQTYWWIPRFMAPLMQSLIILDPPRHGALRGLVDQAFARRAVVDLRPEIEARADALLAALPQTGTVDLIARYTRPLPFAVICDLLGLPEDLRERLTQHLAPLSHASSPLRALYAIFRLKSVSEALKVEFAEQRRAPRPGLIAELIAARDGARQLSEDELLAMVFMLFLAGHETTVHLINGALAVMLADRSLIEQFQTKPETRGLLIEEFMRHLSPVIMSKPHIVAEDTDCLGQPLKRGDRVVAGLIAANYDPVRHDDPEAFHPERRPNAQLGFGAGPHVCLGMQLARLETEVALERFLSRFPTADLPDGPPRFGSRLGLRGPGTLKVRLGG